MVNGIKAFWAWLTCSEGSSQIAKASDAELLALHSEVHRGEVHVFGAVDSVLAPPELAVSKRKDGTIVIGKATGIPAETHQRLHAEMRKRRMVVLDPDPVTKESDYQIRDIVQAALMDRYGGDAAAWVQALDSVPTAGTFIYQADGKSYRASYSVENGTCSITNEEEVEQQWAPVGKARGDGRGVGGPRQGDGGTGTCICPACGHEQAHKRGTPCTDTECAECGEMMAGKTAKTQIVVQKPYSSIADLPEGAKELPKHAKEIMLAAFNAAFKQYEGDEKKAWAVAWAAVKGKYKLTEDGKWVAKSAFVVKTDEEGKVYGLAAVADDEMIAKWAESGGKAEDAPFVVDTQGEWMSEATVTELAEGYLAKVTGPKRSLKVYKAEDDSIVFVGGTAAEIAKAVDGIVGIQHKAALGDAKLLQSAVIFKGTPWPTPESDPLDVGAAWVYAVQTDNEDVRKEIRDGDITGFSIGGYGERVEQ